MSIPDRIKELRRIKASELRPNPNNWRKHPEAQQSALREILDDVGYVDALLARELADGSLELIDGHLRASLTPDQIVPVLILDVSDAEADKILLTHDPLAAMAEPDGESLEALLHQVDLAGAALQQMLAEMAEESRSDHAEDPTASTIHACDIPELFQVVVECESEGDQRAMYDRLTSEGHTCRLLIV